MNIFLNFAITIVYKTLQLLKKKVTNTLSKLLNLVFVTCFASEWHIGECAKPSLSSLGATPKLRSPSALKDNFKCSYFKR